MRGRGSTLSTAESFWSPGLVVSRGLHPRETLLDLSSWLFTSWSCSIACQLARRGSLCSAHLPRRPCRPIRLSSKLLELAGATKVLRAPSFVCPSSHTHFTSPPHSRRTNLIYKVMKFVLASLLSGLSLSSATSLRGVALSSSLVSSTPSIKTKGLGASPPNTYALSVVPSGDFRAYRFGGYVPSSGDFEKRADVYDAVAGTWSESIADLPVVLSSIGGAEFDGDIYLFGGLKSSTGVSSDVYRYEIAGNTYAKVAPMQSAVERVQVVNVPYWGGRLFYSGFKSDKLYYYDTHMNQHSEYMFSPTGENPYCMAQGHDGKSILWMGKNELFSIDTSNYVTTSVAKFPYGDLAIPYTVDCDVKGDGTMIMVDGFSKAVYSIYVANVSTDFAGASFSKVGKVPDYHDKGLSFNLIDDEVIVASMGHTDWVAQVPMAAQQM